MKIHLFPCGNRVGELIIKVYRELVCFGCFFVSGMSCADPVWEFINEIEYPEILSSIATADNVFVKLPVQIPLSNLASLQLEDQIEVKTNRDTSITFSIRDISNFNNGDRGWNAANNLEEGLQTISMTAGREHFLASVITAENSFWVIANKLTDQDDYIGWIYSHSRQTPPPLNTHLIEEDSRDFFSGANILALEEPTLKVSYTAENSDGRFVLPGDETVWTISIENKFDQEKKSLSLDIGGKWGEDLEFPDTSLWTDFPENCRDASSEPYKKPYTITCEISQIEAKSTLEFTMKSQIRKPAYVGPIGFLTIILWDSEASKSYFADTNLFTPIYIDQDYLIDTDLDGVTDFNEKFLKTDPNDKNSALEREAQIDIAVLYTSNYKSEFKIAPETLINSEINFTNEIFTGSRTGVRFDIVHSGLLDYENNCTASRCRTNQTWNDTQTVLDEFGRKDKGRWRESEKIRALYGADLVIILDGATGGDETQGMAVSGGNMRGLVLPQYRTVFVHQSPNYEPYNDWKKTTLTHELGHLFSLQHSRRQDNSNGSFAWATGHGEDDNFATMMAYFDVFNATRINRFSDPSRSDCGYITLKRPCGVDRSDPLNGADAVGAIKATRFQIEQFSPRRPILSTKSSDGKIHATKFLAGAVKDIELGFKTKFSPYDTITASGTINLAPDHVGKVGTTHIIVDAGPLGVFQINRQGQFVALDMAAPVLVGSISPRPLRGIEDLPVLNDFIAGPLGVTEARLNLYFGYTLIDLDLLVYSADPLTIQIGE